MLHYEKSSHRAGRYGVAFYPSCATRPAFALVLALALLGLIFLVLLSLTTLTQFELRAGQDNHSLKAARDNALLGLTEALGELQRAAGPDRRLTARAEILGEGIAAGGNRYWTGIWDSTQPDGPITWLVSGGANPVQVNGDAVTLVPAHVPAGLPAVEAPRVVIGHSGHQRHSYAWWVGDEGVKASLARQRQTAPTLKERERLMLANQTPGATDLELLWGETAVSDRNLMDGLSRAGSTAGLSLLYDDSGQRVMSREQTLAATHDYTVRAYGLLENAAEGGLKRNLSDDTLRDARLINDGMQDFLTPLREAPVADLYPQERVDGKPVGELYPVVTEVVLYMGIFQAKSDAIIKIRYHVDVEFWNPYTVPVMFPVDEEGQTTGYTRGVVVYFDNLPTIQVRDRTPGSDAPDLEDNLNKLKGYEDTNREYLHAWLDISPLEESKGAPVLLPGEVYRVRAPNPLDKPEGLARNIDNVKHVGGGDSERWSANRGNIPHDSAWIEVKAKHARNMTMRDRYPGVRMAFVPFTGEDVDYRELDPFFKVINLPFEDFKFRRQFRVGKKPFSRELSSDYLIENCNIVYHYRLHSDKNDPASVRDLLTVLDPRESLVDENATYIDANGEERGVGELIRPLTYEPDALADLESYFSSRDIFHDEKSRSHEGEYRKMALFDLPLDEPVSVGVLRHAHIHGQTPHVIGRRQGGDVNYVFDAYYMSPLTSGLLLNPWLLPLDNHSWQQRVIAANGRPQADDAAHLMQHGAFNVNSTSVEAWRAVMGAPTLAESDLAAQPRYRDNAFHRLPFYAAADVNQRQDRLILDEDDDAFAVGRRTLSGAQGDRQIEYLAEGIVARLKQRGKPFASLQAFVNAGIIEEALDGVGVERGFDVQPVNHGVFPYGNRYLTQGDIIQRLAPMAAVRSDTFVIRACGETVNANSGETTQAWCEALVRRRPDKLDGTDPMLPATGLGRRFELISFRWLTPDELEGVSAPPLAMH